MALLVVAGVIAVFFYGKQIFATFTSAALTELVQQADLGPEEEAAVLAQIERVTESFKAGEIGFEDLGRVIEEIQNSPILPAVAVIAAKAKYIEPSGLDEVEKAQALITVERVARGVIEEEITEAQLDKALSIVTTGEGDDRRPKEYLTDEELRSFLTEAKRVADEANIARLPDEVDLGVELKRVVDRALGAPTAEQPRSEG